jgi:tetratricopeptide (TPR) repeat protein
MNKKYIGISVLILAVIVAGILYFGLKKEDSKKYVIDRKLSPAQQQQYKDNITKGQETLKALDKNKETYKSAAAEGNIYIAQQYSGLGELSEAENYYNEALKIYSQDASALVGIALLKIEEKDFASARTLLGQATEYAPDNADIWLRYIQITREYFPNESQEIQGLYEQAIQKTRSHIDILTSYAQFLEQKGDIENAKRIWKQAADQNPTNPVYMQEYNRLSSVQ